MLKAGINNLRYRYRSFRFSSSSMSVFRYRSRLFIHSSPCHKIISCLTGINYKLVSPTITHENIIWLTSYLLLSRIDRLYINCPFTVIAFSRKCYSFIRRLYYGEMNCFVCGFYSFGNSKTTTRL